MKVEVDLRGLAFCFAKDMAWNVYMVCDPDHPANYSANGSAQVPLHQNGIDRELIFESEGMVFDVPKHGSGYEQIFNMAADYAHGPNALKFFRTGATDLVSARVPSAIVSANEFTARSYYVQDITTYVGAPPKIIPPVAMRIKATFEVSHDLKVSISDASGTRPLDTFPYRDGTTIKIQLDNDCRVEQQRNDFLDIYEFVQDRRGVRFATGQVRNSPSTGDCDPVDIDPPPV
jgi:hypothetical protein